MFSLFACRIERIRMLQRYSTGATLRRIQKTVSRLSALATTILISLLRGTRVVFAADQVHDELQVYNSEIATVGQWTYQQHLNYAAIGQSQPEVPGGF